MPTSGGWKFPVGHSQVVMETTHSRYYNANSAGSSLLPHSWFGIREGGREGAERGGVPVNGIDGKIMTCAALWYRSQLSGFKSGHAITTKCPLSL